MSAEDIILIRNFKKSFRIGLRRREFCAVRNISFSVHRGEIFGFLGPNGAGKTTTIKALLGLIRPDEGNLLVLGHPPSSMEWRARVGYMPEHPNFYDFLTGLEMVAWFGRLAGMSVAESEAAAKRILERVGLGHAMNRRMRSYSKGMLQRAGLAQAMVSSPELLILDEPMTGLDPIGRKEMRDAILSFRAEGRTVFYSTHILPDVEMTCDRVAIIDKGETKRTDKLSNILVATNRGVSVVIGSLSQAQIEQIQAQHVGATTSDGAVHLDFEDVAEARSFTASALAMGGALIRFEQHKDDLESIFLRSLSEAKPIEDQS